MALEHHLYMDSAASRHDLRDVLVRAGIGLQTASDLDHTSGAFSTATNVVILDDLSFLSGQTDNGVAARCSIMFRDRKLYLSQPEAGGRFAKETVRGVMALLKSFPKADAYWTAYDAEIPMLLRRQGRLVLAQHAIWNDDMLALVDLPHTVKPLGPWGWVKDDATKLA